ncbi:MAG: hypothetical protein KBD48_02150 [Candidatus Pacebacteria bacterium]|nr:hypothetical protein [Candidatus Paceibacterota bacterium]
MGIMAVMSCNGCSKSGKRLEERKAAEMAKKDSIKLEPKKDIDPGFSIGDNGELQGKPIEIIGIPMSVSYAVSLKTWNVSLRVHSKDGLAHSLEVDSATASSIINDSTIVAVRVIGKEVTLLR